MRRKWPMPKNAHYSHYCCHCKWWTFERQAGCANIGTCDPLPQYGGSNPTKRDAYDPPCPLWAER